MPARHAGHASRNEPPLLPVQLCKWIITEGRDLARLENAVITGLVERSISPVTYHYAEKLLGELLPRLWTKFGLNLFGPGCQRVTIG